VETQFLATCVSATPTSSGASRTRSQTPSRSFSRTATPAHATVESAEKRGRYVCLGYSSVYGALGGLVFDYAGTSTCAPEYDWVTPGGPYEGWSLSYVDAGGVTTRLTHVNGGESSLVGTLWDASG
jgi:hypothetical protein